MAASFIDKARIFCRAGKGGNGAVAFHREKYVSAGGPDGGDGGNGGNIVLVVDDNMSTLMDFRYKRKYVADNGMDGQGARKFGKQGKDLTIRVPRGTVVRDERDHQGYVRLRAVHPLPRRQGRLGQRAFRNADASGAPFCQIGP
jgi:GTP-binding protein